MCGCRVKTGRVCGRYARNSEQFTNATTVASRMMIIIETEDKETASKYKLSVQTSYCIERSEN